MKIKLILLIILSASILSSCMLEHKIAYSYQKEMPKTMVLLQNSTEVFLYNSKLKTPKKLSKEEMNEFVDSSFYQSDLIQYIEVENFSNNFEKNLRKSLQKSNFEIYPADSISSFINHKATRVLIDIVQVEVEEHYDEYYDELNYSQIGINTDKYLHSKQADFHSYYDSYDVEREQYYVEILRNALTINLWVNIDIWDNDSTHSNNTIFMNYQLNDDIDGIFIWQNLETVNYIYTIDSIQQYDLWKVEEKPSNSFALGIIDYVINNIIDNRITERKNKPNNSRWKYSMQSGMILPSNEEFPYQILEE